MSGPQPTALALAGRLLRYPAAGYNEDLSAFADLVEELGCASAPKLRALVAGSAGRSPETWQELYTQAFDMTADCALEVGWHLYGEDYARGAFLVAMRERLRALGISEGTDLPDHLGSLLTLLARLEPEEARQFTTTRLLPAVDKILVGLERCESPFEPAVRAVRDVLAGPAVVATEQPEVHHV